MSGLDLAAYFATGALSGILAGLLGLGGGIVTVPALILVFSHQGLAAEWIPHLAVGTSLATIVGTGSASVRAHHRRGAVRWDLFRGLAPGIVIGAWIGAAVAGVMPEAWLKRVFAIFLIFVGARMLTRRAATAPRAELPGTGVRLAAGTGIGTLSALVGIGGGTLTVPFLTRYGLDLRRAVGTSSACGVPLALAGALGFVVTGWAREGLPPGATGFVYWPAVLAMLALSVATAPFGARLAHSLPIDVVRRVFAVALFLVATQLLLG